MFWWLLFGGIVIFAVLLYARLGLMLWRKGVALFEEIERARVRLDTVLPVLAAAEGSPDGLDGSEGSGARSRPPRPRGDVRERAE